MYVKKKDVINSYHALTTWKASRTWKSIHELTKEKVNLQDDWGGSLLFFAAREGEVSLVKALLEKDANPNLRCRNGASSLFIAAQNGHTEIVNTLLQNRADPNLMRQDGTSPLHIAAQKGNTEIVNLLLQNHANPNLTLDGTSPLYIAAHKGNTEIVNLLLQNHANPNLTLDGVSPLYVAVYNGYTEIVNTLLQNRADPNLIRQDGRSLLYVAAQNGHSEIVKVLLEKDANPNLTFTGASPLYIAALNGHIKCCDELLKYSKKIINQPVILNTQGLQDFAKQKNCLDAVTLLIKKRNQNGIPATLPGFTPLHAAVFFGHDEVVNQLLQNGADVIAKCSGISVLDLAETMGNEKILEQVIMGILINLLEKIKDDQEQKKLIQDFFTDSKKVAKTSSTWKQETAIIKGKLMGIVQSREKSYKADHPGLSIFRKQDPFSKAIEETFGPEEVKLQTSV